MSTRNKIVNKLLKSFISSYNISRVEEDEHSLVAVCEYFEHSEKYVMSKKAELWSADCEEFLYVFEKEEPDEDWYKKIMERTIADGMERMNVGPGHMYTYVTVMIICDSYNDDMATLVKKSKFYKSFKWGFHGWLNYRVLMVNAETAAMCSNREGRSCVKSVRKVLKTQ